MGKEQNNHKPNVFRKGDGEIVSVDAENGYSAALQIATILHTDPQEALRLVQNGGDLNNLPTVLSTNSTSS